MENIPTDREILASVDLRRLAAYFVPADAPNRKRKIAAVYSYAVARWALYENAR